jgi:hypothetical protein
MDLLLYLLAYTLIGEDLLEEGPFLVVTAAAL